uniref:Protein croquemort n=1 Tax=Cacopsylla melanoneura TaxID=428564 RepID=A0A8D8V1I8_9HEMI
MSNRRTSVLAVGLAFMVLGALMLLMNLEITPLPSFFQLILQRELALSPTSRSFNIWRSNPVPIYLDFYFFNWTNPGEILNNATKPKFVEMGPYRFHPQLPQSRTGIGYIRQVCQHFWAPLSRKFKKPKPLDSFCLMVTRVRSSILPRKCP